MKNQYKLKAGVIKNRSRDIMAAGAALTLAVGLLGLSIK